MRRARASPIPHPPGLVETPGSNNWAPAPLAHGAEPDRLAPRRTPDPLDPLGPPLEPLRVGLKMARELGGGGIRIIAQVGNPSRQAHQRRAELVRRLARHRGP